MDLIEYLKQNGQALFSMAVAAYLLVRVERVLADLRDQVRDLIAHLKSKGEA